MFPSQQCSHNKLAHTFNWKDYPFVIMELKCLMITGIFQRSMTRFYLIAFLGGMFHRSDNSEICKNCQLKSKSHNKGVGGDARFTEQFSLSNLATQNYMILQ